MKSKLVLLAVHKTFEKDADDKRAMTWYVHDGASTVRLNPEKLEKYVTTVKAGSVMRFTAVNALDVQLQELAGRGVVIQYAHWHDTGIDKGLSPEAIVEAYFKADEAVFRAFTPRPDIAELRDVLAVRNAVVKFYGDAIRRIKQVGRNRTVTDISEDATLTQAENFLKQLNSGMKTPNAKGRDVSLDTKIEELAKAIPECVLFNKIVGFQSYGTAAAVVCASGGLDRFPTVASLWHFFGQHVLEGKAPKRKVGSPCTWSPNGRTALYLMMESIIKNVNNPWNGYMKQAQADELEVHEIKHPGCKTPKGHSLARAKRKTQKEIMKRFYLALKGEEYVSGHNVTKHQKICAANAASAGMD